jgi:hypothetical protein
MLQDVNLFYELFLSTEMWGYLGPFLVVYIGYLLAKKDLFLTVLWFVVECLLVANYLTLVAETPGYWWHIFILMLGGLFTCLYPMFDRH